MKEYVILEEVTSQALANAMNKLSAKGWRANGVLTHYNGKHLHTMELHTCPECKQVDCHDCF
jgi:hypothetical protein